MHTAADCYDGPRSGVADFRGRPHFYRSVYLDSETWDLDEDRFELSPISPEACDLAVEAFRLWQRWQVAAFARTAPARGEFGGLSPEGRPLSGLSVRWRPVGRSAPVT